MGLAIYCMRCLLTGYLSVNYKLTLIKYNKKFIENSTALNFEYIPPKGIIELLSISSSVSYVLPSAAVPY